MIPFSSGFLLTLLAGGLLGGIMFPALVAMGGGLLALVSERLRGPAALFMVGVVLCLLRAGGDPPPPPPAGVGVSFPVAIEGVVSAPPRALEGGRLLITLEGIPPLVVPLEGEGPLPGAHVSAVGRLEAHGRRIKVPAAAGFRVREPPPPLHLPSLVERMRRALRKRLTRGLSPEAAAHLRTLLLGDRALDREDRDRLARIGTLHLFAVSGLHLSVLLVLIRRGLGRLPGPALILLLVYAGLSGFRSPMGRAFLVEAGALVGFRAGRHPSRGAHLLLAMTLLLAWDPEAWRGVGFQLSFSSYAGIILLARPVLEARSGDPLLQIRTRRDRWREALGAALVVSAAAFVASLPVMVVRFQAVPWMSIPASVLLGPSVPLLLLLGFGLLVLPGFPPLVHDTEGLVSLLETVTNVLDMAPGNPMDVARPHPLAFLALLAALLLLASFPRRAAAWIVYALTLPLLLVPPALEPGFRLLDAGRGTAVLVSGKERHWLLDCGPPGARVAGRLLARGIARLDLVAVSHDQADHAGGLAEIRRRLPVERVIVPPVAGTPRRGSKKSFPPERAPEPRSPRARIHCEAPAAHGASRPESRRSATHSRSQAHLRHPPWVGSPPHRLVTRGVRIGGPDPALEVLWPPPGSDITSANDGSLVLHARVGGRSLLLPGDLEAKGLEGFLLAGPPPETDVLGLPHHGAANPLLMDLLLASRPRRIWIPARPGFPAESTMLLLLHLDLPWRGSWEREPLTDGGN